MNKPKLKLPFVSLVLIETRQHELASLALQSCIDKVEFASVLVFTDKPEHFKQEGLRIVQVPDWPDKIGWSRMYWSGVAPYLETPFSLSIQWDSEVADPNMWDDEFLKYDYIGAPWWYTDGRNVGNGGFSLRSTRLVRFLYNNKLRFPCTTALDDDLLCRGYRFDLEQKGFVWAPEDVAWKFAFEHKKPDHGTFGFHAMHNWGYVLSSDELLARARIASKSDYITKNSWMWAKLLERNPDLKAELERKCSPTANPGLGSDKCPIPLVSEPASFTNELSFKYYPGA